MRRRIMRVALISSAVALVLFLVPLAVAVHTLFLMEAHATLERDALQAAVAVDPNFSTLDPAELPEAAAGRRVALYDRAGVLVAGSGPHQADIAVRKALTGVSARSDSDGWIVSVVPITSAEAVTGAVRTAMPVAAVWRRTATVWLLLTLGAGVALAAGIIAARSLARRLVRPMETITAAAQALGDGDFSVRTGPAGIPELDRAADALNATAERLGQLVHRERDVAAHASHQLRTPLAGLRLVLERARTEQHADPSILLVRAIEQVDRLDRTIDDMITLHRGTVPRTWLHLSTSMESAEQRWRDTFAAEGRLIHLDADPSVPPALAAESAVGQILDALLENALRHGSGEVKLRLRDAAGAVAVDVEDEGSGLGDGDDIFLPGVSLSEGSGLGLALARQLASDQGGRLLLSERAPRTRFTVLLPYAPAPLGGRDGEGESDV